MSDIDDRRDEAKCAELIRSVRALAAGMRLPDGVTHVMYLVDAARYSKLEVAVAAEMAEREGLPMRVVRSTMVWLDGKPLFSRPA